MTDISGGSPFLGAPRFTQQPSNLQSYPLRVRDGIMSRLEAMPFFASFHFSTNKALQIQPQSLPFCGVYFIQETGVPDGDSNAGELRFKTMVRIGFSVIVVNNDASEAEATLDIAMQAIAGGLFSDPTFYNNSSFKIQGLASGIRSHVFGSAGLDNETPIAELRYELVCDLGVITYPPLVLDDLKVIHVTTMYPGPAEQNSTQQVQSEYDLEQ